MMQRTMVQRPQGTRCPDCGGPVAYGENRVRCAICGFTRSWRAPRR